MSLEDQIKNAENWFAEELQKKIEEHKNKILFPEAAMVNVKFEDSVLTMDTFLEAKALLDANDRSHAPVLCMDFSLPSIDQQILFMPGDLMAIRQRDQFMIKACDDKMFDEMVIDMRQHEIRKDMEFLRKQGTNFNSRAGYRKALRTAWRARERVDSQIFSPPEEPTGTGSQSPKT